MQQWRSLFFGGILPLVLYAWVEDRYGPLWGLGAGMVLGLGEILWECKQQGRVSGITLGGNGMLFVLGGISFITQEGIWFKLQPSLMEAFFALLLWGSLLLKKPLLLTLMQKQGGLPRDFEARLALQQNPGLREAAPNRAEIFKKALGGLTFRLGWFFALHAGLAFWAALAWSTAAWVALKGIGLTLSLLVYLVVESFVLRYRIAQIP